MSPSSSASDFRTLDDRVNDLFASMSSGEAGNSGTAQLEDVLGLAVSGEDDEAALLRRTKRAQRRRSMRSRSVRFNSMVLTQRVESFLGHLLEEEDKEGEDKEDGNLTTNKWRRSFES